MNTVSFPLNLNHLQFDQMVRLQAVFAEACNFVSKFAFSSKSNSRVGLHHLAYRQAREVFPLLGSQMICNAIYSVSRAYKLIEHLDKNGQFFGHTAKNKGVIFLPNSPVYFDKHTLSFKKEILSMYTLDGRLHFSLNIDLKQRQLLTESKIKEILLRRVEKSFYLDFILIVRDEDILEKNSMNLCEIPPHITLVSEKDLYAKAA